jgi:hypothetical protein
MCKEAREGREGCFPIATLNSTGLPNEGKSFRSVVEFELYDSPS